MAGRGDRPRQLRQLELVAEEPRRHPLPRLEPVYGAEPEIEAGERDRAQQAVDERIAGRAGCPRLCDCAHSTTAPGSNVGSASIWRRTKRQATSARVQASI